MFLNFKPMPKSSILWSCFRMRGLYKLRRQDESKVTKRLSLKRTSITLLYIIHYGPYRLFKYYLLYLCYHRIWHRT